MPFTPAFCPNRPCFYNRSPRPGFARRHGGFASRTRRNVPRFLCTGCGRSFSSSTFRYSYRQKKPHVDPLLMRLLCSGVSLRGAARLLEINPKTVHLKLGRLARHSHRLHRALLARRPIEGSFQLDEMETFESNRFQPLSVPVLIEKNVYFVVSTAAAPLRRKGRMSPNQRRQRREHEALHGRRPSRSDAAVRRCLAWLARSSRGVVKLDSDRKPSYGRIARRLLEHRLLHRTHDADAPRNRLNPLFPINHSNAMARYCLARLRRRSWCVTKRRVWLERTLDMYAGWLNYCRGITIRTPTSPAQALGLARRRLLISEWLSWRQDWHAAGRLLPTPLRATCVNNPIRPHNHGGHFLMIDCLDFP